MYEDEKACFVVFLDFIAVLTSVCNSICLGHSAKAKRDTAGSSFLVSFPTLLLKKNLSSRIVISKKFQHIVHFSLSVAISNVYCTLFMSGEQNLLLVNPWYAYVCSF